MPARAGVVSDVGFLLLAIGVSAKHGVRLGGVPQEAVSQSGSASLLVTTPPPRT
jgi:hypothetical protein